MGDYGDTVWKEDDYRVDWNGSSTFNIYLNGKNVDVWTEYGIDDATAASKAAADHMKDYVAEATEGHWYTR